MSIDRRINTETQGDEDKNKDLVQWHFLDIASLPSPVAQQKLLQDFFRDEGILWKKEENNIFFLCKPSRKKELVGKMSTKDGLLQTLLNASQPDPLQSRKELTPEPRD